MNIQVFTAWLTLIIVAFLLGVTGWSVISEHMTTEQFVNLWAPILTLVIGYWFGQQEISGGATS